MMDSKELKKYNLPEDRLLLAAIDAKPSVVLFMVFMVGMILMVARRYGVGIIMSLLAITAYVALPSRILIEFYQNYLVLYNHANKNDCEMIYYDEVVKWRYVYGVSYDYVEIVLIDDSTHTIDAFSRSRFEGFLNRFLRDKKDKTKRKK